MWYKALTVVLLFFVFGTAFAQDAILPPSEDEAAPVDVFRIVEPAEPAPDPLMKEVNAELDKKEVSVQSSALPVEPNENTNPYGHAAKVISALFFVCALILMLFLLAKRYGRKLPALAGAELAQTLGQVYLKPNVSLHFVETGGKVLVIGLSPNSMTAIAEFDAVAFHAQVEDESQAAAAEAEPGTIQTSDFLKEFKQSLEEMRKPTPAGPSDDAEITALREDVHRLQRYLQEGAHAEKD